jgi:hypothetical protein
VKAEGTGRWFERRRPEEVLSPGVNWRRIRVVPSAEFKEEPLTASIRSIAPYPIPMTDFPSPQFLALEIEGDNFRPTNDVVAFNNEQSAEQRKCRTRLG